MTNRKATSFIELVFDLFYLTAVMFIGIYILVAKDGKIATIYGVMAIVLGLGDSFHLVPRIAEIVSNDNKRFQKSKGVGKLITSVTMTVFYVILWHVGVESFDLAVMGKYTIGIYILAVLRIALCLFPQNRWTMPKPPVKWGVYRNVPFALMGVAVIALFMVNMGKVEAFRFTWLAVLLSFVFYIPVVLFSNKCPKIGMLMIPKTVAYVWIVSMGLGL